MSAIHQTCLSIIKSAQKWQLLLATVNENNWGQNFYCEYALKTFSEVYLVCHKDHAYLLYVGKHKQLRIMMSLQVNPLSYPAVCTECYKQLYVTRVLEILSTQKIRYSQVFFVSSCSLIQSLTKAIIYEQFYYINGYFRVQVTTMNIHSKCHTYQS